MIYNQIQNPTYFFTKKSKISSVYKVSLEFFKETKVKRKEKKISRKAKRNNWLYQFMLVTLILFFRALYLYAI